MTLSTQPYKGARDFYPEDKRIQKYMFNTLRRVVERYGYEEYDAPILESIELYRAKSGEEIVNEQTYSFTDRGGREVVIRPEMTPTVSRMVAGQRQELGYPLRWYSIPNLWRYERPQKGRLREHWQLNVDVFGISDMSAEYELILLTDSIMREFNATRDMYVIKLNSRKLMDYIMKDYLGLDDVQTHTLSKLIDRMHKMERSAFVAATDALLRPTQRDAGISQKLLDILVVKVIDDLPTSVKESGIVDSLTKLIELLHDNGVSNVEFDISIMRGFDYYTDIVFEMNDTDPENNRAMMGGGRYDGLVGLFGVEPVPTVGFGWGDVTLLNFLKSHDLLQNPVSETEVYAILIGDVYDKAQKLLANLRKEGVTVAVDNSGRKLAQTIKNATKKNIPYALFIGEKELTEGQYNLKDLQSGIEETHSAERIISTVLDSRKNTIL
ncbi:MAG: histidyl-tRNA synthetase [Patescibacteria group bacterium]|nr:histidyl-tRNA synthetase [Patescibacteria group bacterium]